LLISVFVIATCGLIYELVAGTLASYLLGDSVTQFSTIIGAYLFSMGIGAFFSRFFTRNLLSWFIQLEIMVGLIGGISSTVLFLLFDQVASFRIILYLLVGLTGILVGLEIPLLMNILKNRMEFKDLVSKVFTFDYIGALLASIICPLLLVPSLGLMRTSLFFGILNVAVAIMVLVRFRKEVNWANYLLIKSVAVIVLLVVGFIFANRIMAYSEALAFNEPVIFSKSSPYQRVVLTKNRDDLRLYLNGNLQFSSRDEYRYHEALVHPPMTYHPHPRKILILGGGDGLAAREVLKYPDVESIQLVDLDPTITDMFRNSQMLQQLNHNSLHHPKLKIINEDAFTWLRNNPQQFDVVIIDFPDPSAYSVGKLYTTTFYKQLQQVLNDQSVVVVQCTSPIVAPQSFWCINVTLQQSGLQTLPYHFFVPSFGEWGYIMASRSALTDNKLPLAQDLRVFSREAFEQMRYFTPDMRAAKAEVNKLNNQVLVHYFEKEWAVYTN
jgi:spermidine synthase